MKKYRSEKIVLNLLFWIFFTVFGMALATDSWAYPFNHIRNNSDGSQTLIGHVPTEVTNGTATFRHHPSFSISAQVIMPLQNQEKLSKLLQDIYDPNSPDYHHWLTPDEFAQQFAPSAVNSVLIKEYLEKEGLSVTGQSPNGSILYVTGYVSAFEHAFGLRINYYQRSNGAMFFAPDVDPIIPAALADKILAIGGLDNFPKYQARIKQLTDVSSDAIGTGPGGFLAPNDVKTAYNLNSVITTGSGQTVALFELDGYNAADITAYESHFSIPNVQLTNVYIDGFSGKPNYKGGGADEVTLDIETVAAFAPGSAIYVYEASNTTQSWIDEWTKIASDNKAKVVSCSWGEPEPDSPTLTFDYNIFQQMAAQGQGVFVAAGDNGAYDAGTKTLCVDEPASQPYATAVGISKMTFGSNNSYGSESASVYGGGGVSAYWTIPTYQTTLVSTSVKAAMVSTTKRNLPDVVLTADSSTAYAFYINGSWGGWYGSSISSPIWASFISCVNEALGSSASIGFANPALYQLAQTSSYTSYFNDIVTGNNGYYPAEAGFDDAVGLGSFNGFNLYKGLLGELVAVLPPPAPTILSVTSGNAMVSLSWTSSPGAVSYNVTRSTRSSLTNATTITGIKNTTYTDTSVSNGAAYYYAVSAVNSAGAQGPNSIVVSAMPQAPATVAAPANLTGSATTYARKPAILLQWKQSTSPNITKNNIYYSVGNGAYSKLGSVSATIAVTVTGVSNGVIYNFYVTAVNSKGVESSPSNKITVIG